MGVEGFWSPIQEARAFPTPQKFADSAPMVSGAVEFHAERSRIQAAPLPGGLGRENRFDLLELGLAEAVASFTQVKRVLALAAADTEQVRRDTF